MTTQSAGAVDTVYLYDEVAEDWELLDTRYGNLQDILTLGNGSKLSPVQQAEYTEGTLRLHLRLFEKPPVRAPEEVKYG